MAVRCISPYKATRIAFQPGDIVDDAEIAAFVLRDSPGSFEVFDPAEVPVEPPAADTKALEAPQVDKAIRPKRDQAMTKSDHPGLLKE